MLDFTPWLDPLAAERLAQHIALADPFIEAQVASRLAGLAGLTRTEDELRLEVVEFEDWKRDTFLSSGVFPKRYFGWFDGQGGTAEDEWRMQEVVIQCRRTINAWSEDRGSDLRVTDSEIAVTFIAEGAAVWFGNDNLHPVYDVGLDDIHKGQAEYGVLLEQLNTAVGVDTRHDKQLTFEEAIVGTALMWIWEKDIANDDAGGAIPRMEADLQFITGSLVYNSGILHSRSSWLAIRDFTAAQLVWDKSERNKARKWALPVWEPTSLPVRLEHEGYPDQGTDWLASLHILQRYGAWVALRDFTDVFDDEGNFAREFGAVGPLLE
jgi:hypothetical protein